MIFTFYSYKGGVGRSMALANVAEILYRQGKRVVMIDWDLEAPGLESYFFSSEDQREAVRAQPGLIDILETYKSSFSRLPPSAIPQPETAPSADPLNQLMEALVSLYESNDHPGSSEVVGVLRTFGLYGEEDIQVIAEELDLAHGESGITRARIYGLLNQFPLRGNGRASAAMDQFDRYIPSFLPLLYPVRPPVPGGGERPPGLWLLTAGQRDGSRFSRYSETVQQFSWTDFYHSYQGAHYFNWMRRELDSFADIVLIDSRTGVTEMGGVCTRQMADVVVLITAPNSQNIFGVAEMVKSFTRDEITEARKGEPVKALVIPSRVDTSELRERNQFQARFYRIIGKVLGESIIIDCWNLGIPYIPYYNYHEELAVGARSDDPSKLEQSTKASELEDAYRKLAAYLLEGRMERTAGPETAPKEIAPYVGLRPFQADESALFFGRSGEISQMLTKYSQNGFLIVSGPAGSGKTSTLWAGLIPALQSADAPGRRGELLIVSLRPGVQPFHNLAEAIIAKAPASPVSTDELYALLTSGPDQLRQALDQAGLSGAGKPLMVIDQVEELYTLIPAASARAAFLEALDAWWKSGSISMILSVRSEYCEQLLRDLPGAVAARQSVFNLDVLDERAMRQIMTEPAAKAGLVFEPGLVDRIMADSVDIPSKLALFQFTLEKLWQSRKENVLTHAAYDELGQMSGIVRQWYGNKFKAFPASYLEAAVGLVMRLVNPLTERLLTMPKNLFTDEELLRLKPFIDEGLIRTSIRNGAELLEPAHDSVIAAWPGLKDRMNADRAFLLWRQDLDLKLDLWIRNNRDRDFLLNTADLRVADEWLGKRAGDLTAEETAFVRESHVREARQKAMRKRYRSLVGVLLFLILAGGISFLFLYRQNRTEIEEELLTKDSLQKEQAVLFTAATENIAAFPDADTNLRLIHRYYQLDPKYQEVLKSKKEQIELNLIDTFQRLTSNFYQAYRQKNLALLQYYLADTVSGFGNGRRMAKAAYLSQYAAFARGKILTSRALDTVVVVRADTDGFRVIYLEQGNFLPGSFREYRSMTAWDTLYLDWNHKIRALTYSLQDTVPVRMTIQLFVCRSADKRAAGISNKLLAILEETGEFNVIPRFDFQCGSDSTQRFYVPNHQIRFNGPAERKTAEYLQRLLGVAGVKAELLNTRTRTYNSISIFISASDGLPGSMPSIPRPKPY